MQFVRFGPESNYPGGTTPPAETSRVQALHASPDAPAVNVTIGATEVPDVDYKTGTGFPELIKALFPAVERRARDTEIPTGPRHLTRLASRMLQDP